MDTKKPSCIHCHVQNVCFMPKERSEFQKNFKALTDQAPQKIQTYQKTQTYLEVVTKFSEFIAENCRFYKETASEC